MVTHLVTHMMIRPLMLSLTRFRSVVAWLLTASFLVIGVGCSQLALKERELVFRIEPGSASWYTGLPQGMQEFDLPVPGKDGNTIHTWWWPASDARAPTLLYLHGSRWNLTGHLTRIAQLRDFGFSVLAIDYRGFGRSKGELPSETAVYEDAEIAWKRVTEIQPDASRRYIYGHSLGGAVAIELATRLRAAGGSPAAAGLIVESSFTTLGDIADELVGSRWPVPVRWVLTQKFDSVSKVKDVGLPTLFVHGTGDRYVPARFSESLHAAATGPKRLLIIDGGSHNNSMRVGRDAYAKALREFFGVNGSSQTAARQ